MKWAVCVFNCVAMIDALFYTDESYFVCTIIFDTVILNNRCLVKKVITRSHLALVYSHHQMHFCHLVS